MQKIYEHYYIFVSRRCFTRESVFKTPDELQYHIEFAYYGPGIGRKDICVHCAAANCTKDAESCKKFKIVLLVCKQCIERKIFRNEIRLKHERHIVFYAEVLLYLSLTFIPVLRGFDIFNIQCTVLFNGFVFNFGWIVFISVKTTLVRRDCVFNIKVRCRCSVQILVDTESIIW